MKQYVLGIDQGTTSSRAAVFDAHGGMVSISRQRIGQFYPQPGWVEEDPMEIWASVLHSMEQAIKLAAIPVSELAAIGVANQRDTLLFWNPLTGESLTPAMVWQDCRTAPLGEAVPAGLRQHFTAMSGMPLISNAAVLKLKWFLDHVPQLRRQAAAGGAVCGTVDSWLFWQLSGGRLHMTDFSNASVTALLDRHRLCYGEDILSYFDIPAGCLPQLRFSSEVYGLLDEALLGCRIPLAGCLGDQSAALLGQGCIQPGMAKNTYGTGSFLMLNAGAGYRPPEKGLLAPIAWSLPAGCCQAVEGIADASGASIQWLQEKLGILQDPSQAAEMAAAVPDTDGVYFVPAFTGLGSPYLDSQARGTICGITPHTRAEHLVRAALEAMAFQTRDCLLAMEQAAGQRLSCLRADGGGADNDFLLQFQADILGIPVERPEFVEATARGAAYMAGLAAGLWDSLEEAAALWRLQRRFLPRMGETERAARCAAWQRAVGVAARWLR